VYRNRNILNGTLHALYLSNYLLSTIPDELKEIASLEEGNEYSGNGYKPVLPQSQCDQRAQQNQRLGQHSPKKVQHDAGNSVTFQDANNLTNANCYKSIRHSHPQADSAKTSDSISLQTRRQQWLALVFDL